MADRKQPFVARMNVPPWFWGMEPAGFFHQAELRAKKCPTDHTCWQVQTNEDYFRRRPGLVTVEHLAGPLCSKDDFNRFQQLAATEEHSQADEQSLRALKKRMDRASATGDPVDFFSAWMLHTMIAPTDELADLVKQIHEAMKTVTLAEDDSVQVFPNCGVHVVRRARALVLRTKLTSVLIRLMYDSELRAGDVSRAKAATESEGLSFSSSDELYNGVIMFDAYLGPLYGALTPAIWCAPVHRELGTIIYSLGQPLAGTRGEAAELLQLLPSQGSVFSTKIPEISSAASRAAITWWTERLDDMFGILTDPAVFIDTDGALDPRYHLRTLLTVEQLFRRVSSVQVSHRDSNAQRVLLFTVLDTLERLTGRKLDVHCTLKFAKKTLAGVREKIPPEAQEILVPAAERAVVALEQVQDGFFLARQFERDYVEIPFGEQEPKKVVFETAAAQYIKMLRDATHGHGTNKDGLRERIDALLANHTGYLPYDLPLLAYLYLLDVLANPEILRLKLAHR